jgi:bombesin receptor subtype-3
MTENSNFALYSEADVMETVMWDNFSYYGDLQNATLLALNVTEQPYVPYEHRPETYIVPILFALIFLVGILGNGTLVVVFIRHRAMRNVPNT